MFDFWNHGVEMMTLLVITSSFTFADEIGEAFFLEHVGALQVDAGFP